MKASCLKKFFYTLCSFAERDPFTFCPEPHSSNQALSFSPIPTVLSSLYSGPDSFVSCCSEWSPYSALITCIYDFTTEDVGHQYTPMLFLAKMSLTENLAKCVYAGTRGSS